ncbi:MAG: hypothetical protein Q8Q94_00650 [bacterium]|nr:hypothetical protein [bacterium]MDZ4299686.1 hypothetical protein [Candidatus Sungbacteria bacterium]
MFSTSRFRQRTFNNTPATARRIDERYMWTAHARQKMAFYRLTESRIKRIIRYPSRIEQGILETAVACMQPAAPEAKRPLPFAKTGSSGFGRGSAKQSEIWVMYVVVPARAGTKGQGIKIITAWRYPGKSPERDPVPPLILEEVRRIIHAS